MSDSTLAEQQTKKGGFPETWAQPSGETVDYRVLFRVPGCEKGFRGWNPGVFPKDSIWEDWGSP